MRNENQPNCGLNGRGGLLTAVPNPLAEGQPSGTDGLVRPEVDAKARLEASQSGDVRPDLTIEHVAHGGVIDTGGSFDVPEAEPTLYGRGGQAPSYFLCRSCRCIVGSALGPLSGDQLTRPHSARACHTASVVPKLQVSTLEFALSRPVECNRQFPIPGREVAAQAATHEAYGCAATALPLGRSAPAGLGDTAGPGDSSLALVITTVGGDRS